MSIGAKLTPKIGKVFDKLRGGKVFDPTDKLYLMTAADNENEYDLIGEVVGKWFYFDSKTSQSGLIEIADSSEEMADRIACATHCRINDNVFVIAPQSDDRTPLGARVLWTLAVERVTTRAIHSDIY